MPSLPCATMLALILPLLILLDQARAGQKVGLPNASPPSTKIAQINPYMPLTKQGFQPQGDGVTDKRHWHAFVLVGTETFFASHITSLVAELHMHQLVIEISLPEPYRTILIEERKKNPDDSFFMANALPDKKLNTDGDAMNIPELAAGLRTKFIGNVWHGIPNKPKYYGVWPWEGVKPLISNVEISIKRVVHSIPLSKSMNHPDRLSYLLFGAGDEAHLMYIQTMHGNEPDFEHVASLKEVPDWLPAHLLKAGAVIDLPDEKRFGSPEDKKRGVRCASPFADSTTIEVRYRGLEPKPPRRSVAIGNNKWFCTRSGNIPDPCEVLNTRPCGTETPKKYLSP